MPDEKRFHFFVATRLVVVLAIFAATTFLFLKGDLSLISRFSYRDFALLTLCTTTISLVILVSQRRGLLPRTLPSHLLLVTDLGYTTILVILTGGVLSPFPSLYLIVIIGAGITLSRREAILAAALCTIVHGALLNLQYYGYLTRLRLYPGDFGLADPRQAVYGLLLATFAFFLAAVLTGHLAERARRGEEALEAREIDYAELKELHDAVIRTVDSGFITLTPDGRVRVFNPYAVMILGRSLDQVYDRHLTQLFPSFAPLVESRGRGEVSLTVGDELRTLGVHVIDMREGTILIHFKDITEVKRLRERIARAERLAALGEMAARMAHEIRNPLASMSGSAQLLAKAPLSGEDRSLLAIIERESTRLDRLLSEFLAYAREYRPSPERVDLRRFCLDILSLLEHDPRTSRIRFRLEAEGGKGWFDPVLVEQALINLLFNAAEASPGDAEVILKASGDGSGCRFVVTDRGAGFPPEILTHLYEPFRTTKPGGSGLGLSIVHRIVDAHGGEIVIDTEQGRGSSITLIFPAGGTG